MARSSRNSAIAAVVLLRVALAAPSVSAHRLDEYLQAARIAIASDDVRIELDLTPGIAVAERIVADLDRDRDGTISAAEERAYVGRVLDSLSLDLDGHPLVLHVTRHSVPSIAAMRAGTGTMRVDFAAALPAVATGTHQLTFRNGHRPDIGVYLANALVPASDRVAVTRQDRDYNQRILDVDYVLRDQTAGVGWRAGLGAGGMLILLWFVVQQKGTQ